MEQIREVARNIVMLVITLAIVYAGLNAVTLNTFFVPTLSHFFGWIHETASGRTVGIIMIVLAVWPVKTTHRVRNIVRRTRTNEEPQRTLVK